MIYVVQRAQPFIKVSQVFKCSIEDYLARLWQNLSANNFLIKLVIYEYCSKKVRLSFFKLHHLLHLARQSFEKSFKIFYDTFRKLNTTLNILSFDLILIITSKCNASMIEVDTLDNEWQ